MEKLVVIALGGNALEAKGEIPNSDNQLKNINKVVPTIIELIKKDYKIVITHGNGPQVGRMLIQNENADSEETPAADFDVVDAMSQASIGYQIEQSLKNHLHQNGIEKEVATLITQVLVDKKDPSFDNPTKPIGPFYDENKANELVKTKKYNIKADANRGFRRVVASPKPQEIIELEAIKTLLRNNNIVVCCGGGGIPVISENDQLSGVAAVIDKDKTTALLAKELMADHLVILTAVSNVAIRFGTPEQIDLHYVTTAELADHIKNNEFAPGSMLPKIEATINFVNETKKEAIITDLKNLRPALEGEVGTIIRCD